MDNERRSHLGRLLHIETRSLSKLPRLDLPSLRTTTHARQSGVDLRSADAVAAELYLQSLRGDVTAALTRAVDAVVMSIPEQVNAHIEIARRGLDELARLAEMLETMMYPRVTSPAIEVGVAFERACASRAQALTVAGEANAEVAQVRGLLRLLAEFVESVGGQAFVHATRTGGWIEVAVSPSATGSDEMMTLSAARIELLRFAAYLLRAQARFADGAWQIAFVSVGE